MKYFVLMFVFMSFVFVSSCSDTDKSIESDNDDDKIFVEDPVNEEGVDDDNSLENDSDLKNIDDDKNVDSDQTEACEDGDTRESKEKCGPNNQGLFIEKCSGEKWELTEECTEKDECENGKEQNGTTKCGLNEEGVLIQECKQGRWVDSQTCTGNDECKNGKDRNSSEKCGLNNNGLLVEKCENGKWTVTDSCNDGDECENGKTQDGNTTCGLNDEGVYTQKCENGFWIDTETCTGNDECKNGKDRNSSEKCGLNNNGLLVEKCENGQWTVTDSCNDSDECENGKTQDGNTACGINDEGVYTQKCENGFWIDTETCTGNDDCKNNTVQNENITECIYSNTCHKEGEKTKTFQKCENGIWSEKEEKISCQRETDGMSCGINKVCENSSCISKEWGTEEIISSKKRDVINSCTPIPSGGTIVYECGPDPVSIVDKKGNITAVWMEEDNNITSIWANRYDITKNSWGIAEQIEKSDKDVYDDVVPHLLVDEAGNVTAIWKQSMNIVSNKFDITSQKWGEEQVINANYEKIYRKDEIISTVDKNGNITIVWMEEENEITSLWSNRYDAASNSWSTPELVEKSDDDIRESFKPHLMLDGSGNITVIYQNTYSSIIANRFDIQTKKWGEKKNISLGTRYLEDDYLISTVDKNGNITALWMEEDNNITNLWSIRYDAASDSWIFPELVEKSDDDIRESFKPHLMLDESGNITVIYQNTYSSIIANRFDIQTKKWGEKKNISLGTRYLEDDYLISTVDKNGNITALWMEEDSSITSLWSIRYDSASDSWSFPELIEKSDANVDDDVAPHLLVDENDIVTAIWMQDYEIFSNRFK